MTAKEYLSQYRFLTEKLNAKLERYQELQDRATHITPNSNGCGSGSEISDKVGKIGTLLADISEEMYDDIKRLRQQYTEIEGTISQVEDDTLQVLLEKRYIAGKTWEQIAVEMNFCYRHTCRLHGIALREVDRLLKMS